MRRYADQIHSKFEPDLADSGPSAGDRSQIATSRSSVEFMSVKMDAELVSGISLGDGDICPYSISFQISESSESSQYFLGT